MRGPTLLLALAVSFAALAGCTGSSEPEAPNEIVVKSQPKEVRSDEEPAEEARAPREPGMILGVVVDAGIRPLANARVMLPGLDLADDTDREGVFAFPDLAPSVYFVRAEAPGYAPAETEVEVPEGEQVRIRFVLDAVPPPEPYHVTKPFKGFADVTDVAPFGFGWTCGGCVFPLDVDPAASAYVIEAAMDPYQWDGTAGNNSFRVDVYSSNTGYTFSDNGPNPYLAVLYPEDLGNETRRQQLYISPDAFPLPESSKQFYVYVTTWYNSVPPAGWSFVAGST